MTYHLGYFMHNDVQRAKADAVCPEGNDGSGSVLRGKIKSGHFS